MIWHVDAQHGSTRDNFLSYKKFDAELRWFYHITLNIWYPTLDFARLRPINLPGFVGPHQHVQATSLHHVKQSDETIPEN